MKHASLFSGIGGFDLAADWMGWNNLFHCEFNPFCQKILTHYWPNSKSYGDIKQSNFKEWRGEVDVISGGFPCQPYSTAGKRRGKNDDRHLWPQMLRAIKEVQPTWVVGENVHGLLNWNGGLVFDEVQLDLENEGYEIISILLPACGINAPHRRERIWFIAYSKSNGRKRSGANTEIENGQSEQGFGRELHGGLKGLGVYGNVTDSLLFGQAKYEEQAKRTQQYDNGNIIDGQKHFKNFPTQYPICSGNDGISERLDGVSFSKWRNESLKAYGNAVVPQVVYKLFLSIQNFNK